MTQNERILRYLDENGSITQLEAMQEFGIYRLASRISDLKRQGFKIRREMVKGRNRYDEPTSFARYSLEEGQ